MAAKRGAAVHAGHDLDVLQPHPLQVAVVETIVRHHLQVKANQLHIMTDSLLKKNITLFFSSHEHLHTPLMLVAILVVWVRN